MANYSHWLETKSLNVFQTKKSVDLDIQEPFLPTYGRRLFLGLQP